MGITTLNGALRSSFGRSINVARPSTNRLEVFCDGQASKWTPNLANNEIWLDGSAFYRPGAGQVGPTFQYKGAGSCAVYGMVGDRGLAQRIQQSDYADFVAASAPNWVQFGADTDTPASISNGMVAYPSGLVFDLIRLVFTGGPGSVTIVSV